MAISIAALLALVFGAAFAIGWERDAQDWVRHTLRVETAIQATLNAVSEAEADQRSYLLTGREAYRTRFDGARAQIGPALDDLTGLTADNARQRANVARLRTLIEDRLQTASATLDLRRDPGRLASLIARGTATTDAIRAHTTAMMAEEAKLLDSRSAAARRAAAVAETFVIALGLLLLVLASLIVRSAQRQLTQSRASELALRELNRRMQAEAAARSQAEEKVRQMQKIESLGQLTGGIAHDFNNMLAVVIGSLELASRRMFDDVGRAHAHIENALAGAQRAAQLTARLLAFSRRQPLQPQVVEANRLVGGMSELLRRSLGEHIEIETVLAAGLWRIYADPAQLENAILNLAINARDAMPRGGKLTLETGNAVLDEDYARSADDVAAGQYVMIGVSDTGLGMTPEVVSRIFEPFFTTKNVGQGTGLGLSQVYGFIKQSGGHIRAYSEPGQGTTIKLYLPRDTQDAAPCATSGEPSPPRSANGEVILVVEDDEHVRGVSIDHLRDLGYVVIDAAGPAQALAIMEAEAKVDLLFTDVVMPGMNGRELAEEVRRRWPQTRILFTTGYTRNAIVHNGVLDLGVDLLAKPFRRDQLARKVREVLDRDQALQPPRGA